MELVEGKIQIAPYGHYDGYINDAGEKESFDITPEDVQNMANYFNTGRGANGQKLLIDNNHASMKGLDAPAMGWIKQLEADAENGLMATVEFLAETYEQIKKGALRYISPVIFKDNYIDEITGEVVPCVLFNAAITNTPFLPNIQDMQTFLQLMNGKIKTGKFLQLTNTITLKKGGYKMAVDANKEWATMCKAAGLPPDADTGTLTKYVSTLAALKEAMSSAGSDGAPPPDANIDLDGDGDVGTDTDADGMSKIMSKFRFMQDGAALSSAMRKILNLPVNANHKIILSKFTEVAMTKPDDSATVLQLKKKVEMLEAKNTETEADIFIASNRKKIDPTARMAFRQQFLKDPDGVKSIVASMRENPLFDKLDDQPDEPTDPADIDEKSIRLTEAEKVYCMKSGQTEKAFLAQKVTGVKNGWWGGK